MVLLNTTPELMRSISSEIESQFFLNGYDICVVPYARKGKEISITKEESSNASLEAGRPSRSDSFLVKMGFGSRPVSVFTTTGRFRLHGQSFLYLRLGV